MHIGSFVNNESFFIMNSPVAADVFFRQVLAKENFSSEDDIVSALKSSLEWADLGDGVIIPHARVRSLPSPVLRVAVLNKGFSNHVLSGLPVICFVLLSPENQPDYHLQILSHLTWLIRRKGLRENLASCASSAEMPEILRKAEIAGTGGFANLSRDEIFREIQSGVDGISSEEALKRLNITGPNVLKKIKAQAALVKLGRNFVSIFALLLWVSGALCFLPGVDMPQLGWAIFTVVVVNALFSFWQEFKAEKAVEALQKLIPRKAKVLRGGVLLAVDAAYLVHGDVIVLEEGDVVPADARLIESSEMRVNNASLTGESRPIYKFSDPLPGQKADDFLWTELPNMVFAGTSVASGGGRAVVTGTGMDTEVGKIASLTQEVRRELSPLQKEMKTVVNVITALSLGIGVLFFFLGMGLGGLSFISAFVFTIGITVANIPEGLLPTVTLSLAMGVQRLARKNVLVKHLASVETLGSTDVICTDKTGTLTTNRISVVALFTFGAGVSGLDGNSRLYSVALLCNNARFSGDEVLGDPTEGALLAWAEKFSGETQASYVARYPRLAHNPFESVRKRMSTVHKDELGNVFVCVKGAPLELFARCTSIMDGGSVRQRKDSDEDELRRRIDDMASRGLRTLALAWRDGCSIENVREGKVVQDYCENGLCFLGLFGMEDPPRVEVPQAIELCATAGIRIVMITGDYGLTAMSIAGKIGMTSLEKPGRHLSGAEVERMNDAALDEFLFSASDPLIFSRMAPDQKMRIVTRFKDSGKVVAATGDGVNDAAALKKADIGIAMGKDANDVAKEAASMIVLDGNFSSIVSAVEEGRAVYANIRRFVTYILSSNMPELAPFILFVMVKVPLALTVMQILAIDLGTDLVPALGLGVEEPEKGLMSRPPRKKKERLINTALIIRAYLWLGALEILISMSAFFFSLYGSGWRPGEVIPESGDVYFRATTMTLASIVFCQIGNVFACRTETQSVFRAGLIRNRLVILGITSELAILMTLVNVPFFCRIFGLHPLSLTDWALLCFIPPVFLGLEEARKIFLRKRQKQA